MAAQTPSAALALRSPPAIPPHYNIYHHKIMHSGENEIVVAVFGSGSTDGDRRTGAAMGPYSDLILGAKRLRPFQSF